MRTGRRSDAVPDPHHKTVRQGSVSSRFGAEYLSVPWAAASGEPLLQRYAAPDDQRKR